MTPSASDVTSALLLKAKKKRATCRSTITKRKNQLDIESAKENCDFPELNSMLQNLIKTLENSEVTHNEIISVLDAEEEIETEFETHDTIEMELRRIIARIKDLIKSHSNEQTAEGTPLARNIRNTSQTGIPELKLPSFDGNITEFKSFWERFSVVHSNVIMNDATKFTHLMNVLRGRARQLLEGFSLETATYNSAIEMLKNEFGNQDKIRLAHFDKLANIEPPNEICELQEFYNEIVKNLRQLQTLKFDITVNEFSLFLAASLAKKIPRQILNCMERANEWHPWNLENLQKHLKNELEHLNKTVYQDNTSEKRQYQGNHGAAWPRQQQQGQQTATRRFTTAAAVTTPSYHKQCRLCGDRSHTTKLCRRYNTKQERDQRAKELNLCFHCYGNNHRVSDCYFKPKQTDNNEVDQHVAKGTSKYSSEMLPQPNKVNVNRNQATTSNVVTSHNVSVIKNKSVALPTAEMEVNCNGQLKKLRGLFDQGSQRSFIRRDVIGILQDKELTKIKLTIDGFGMKGKLQEYEIADVDVSTNDGIVPISVIIVENLPERIIIPGIAKIMQKWTSAGEVVADSFEQGEKAKIDLLIGADYMYDFVECPQKDGINVIRSKLGLMVTGIIEAPTYEKMINNNTVTVLNIGQQNNTVDCLWKLDAIGINTEQEHPDDASAMKSFKESIKYDGKRYMARLPWRFDHPHLPTNFGLARGRLEGNLKRLRQQPERLKIYDNLMKEQEKQGFIERVNPEPGKDGYTHYLAHHAVNKDSPTTPIRIVFDCSAKTNKTSVSLNDCLYSGPNMVPELARILLRFRLNKYAVVADIRKAFLMISLDKKDRDATRFLWMDNPDDPNSKLVYYRFTAVLFGATCSQFILNATIKQHLHDAITNSTIAKALARNIYVDNIMYTCNTEKQVSNFYETSKKLMKNANLHLREWTTNACEAKNRMITAEVDEREVVPVLGLKWQLKDDTLSYASHVLSSEEPTKRKILSGLAAQFDPLGYISPVLITGKLLIQDLWSKNYEWDDEISNELQERWTAIVKELNSVHTVVMKRSEIDPGVITLHAFADASLKAYGACIYAVQNGKASLIMSKSRVAPLKQLTIPKLELTAITLAARLINYVIDTYSKEWIINNSHVWSDNQVALGWLHAQRPLRAYEQNRVDEIRKRIPTSQLHYVGTRENPADILSRGCTVAKLIKSEIWWHGPKWITDSTSFKEFGEPSKFQVNNVAVSTQVCEENIHVEKTIITKLSETYGSFNKIVRIHAWMKRFTDKLRKIKLQSSPCLTATELIDSKGKLIQLLQKETFPEELEFLEQNVRKTPPILVKRLNLILENGIIKCMSRLGMADVADTTKRPTLLPSKHAMTRLIIEQTHAEGLHTGINSTIASIRERWWIPRVRQRVKAIIARCVTCKREHGRPYDAPPPPPLPEVRVNKARPFSVVGVDYGGPLITNNEGRIEKRYVALFTCATTRAIHLEVAKDLSVEAFMQVFNRFVARRSYPAILISDNAKNFQGTATVLQSWENHSGLQNQLAKGNCEWRFIPSRAPWYGGFYERLIGMTKCALRKALGRAVITDEELQTILCRIESQLNDRPLTYVSDNIDDEEALTPSIMMHGYRLNSLPNPILEPDEEEDPTIMDRDLLTKRQHHCQLVFQKAWSRWEKEYLTLLRTERTGKENGCQPTIGDVVLVHDETPKLKWKYGKITKLHEGIDGKHRSATLRSGRGIINRPIIKLYPLECSDKLETPNAVNKNDATKNYPQVDEEAKDKLTEERTPGQNIREIPRRAAALRARERMLEQMELFAGGQDVGF